MTEATNIWTATASEITNAVRESVIAMGCGEPQTGDVYDQLMLLGRSGVEELVPSVREIGAREFESVMAVVVDLLGGDGIAVHGELPIWLRVYPNVEGRLPAFSVDDWRWIRLSTIQEVQPAAQSPLAKIRVNGSSWSTLLPMEYTALPAPVPRRIGRESR
jgi:hypothetical protein